MRVFAISNSGRSKPVIEAGRDRALLRRRDGASRGRAPRCRGGEHVIAVTVPEVEDVLRPTPSRYAHLAIVDTIATGLAARLGPQRETLRRVRYTLARIGVAIPSPAPTRHRS